MISTILAAMILFYFLWKSYRLERIYRNLNRMIDAAIKGEFQEQSFTESENSKMEEKLKRFLSISKLSSKNLEKEKAEIYTLISDISHQTRTPLSNILLYTQLLEEKVTEPELSELFSQVTAQTQKLQFLIQALIKSSRLETEMLDLKPSSYPVSPMLSSAILTAAHKAADKNISIIPCFENNTENICAVFDRKWTEEAIYNLLDNAVKYTSCQGNIKITVISYELFLRIDIEDNGIGIREDELPKIFGRFYRSRDVKEQEGIGIGLYLSREIFHKQNGYMKVRSVYGKGTLFSVFLPLTPQNPA